MNQEYRTITRNAFLYRQKYLSKNNIIPCVAVIDTGISPHIDLSNRIIGFHDMINGRTAPYDDNGHGTHIAGIIAGYSKKTSGRYHGIFPECHLFGIKALDKNGVGKVPSFIAGTEYLIKHHKKYNIRVINISLGAEYDDSEEHRALISCVEYAWDCGIVVTAAAGNNGPKQGSVTVPGISKKIITVGTYDDDIPILVSPSGQHLSHYSGRGPTAECVIKPDILLPGANILSLNHNMGYAVKSGTSMSTPMLSGAIALVLYAHPDITPKEIKRAVKASTVKGTLRFDSNLFFSYF